MAQKFTSKNTSINSKRLPAIYSRVSAYLECTNNLHLAFDSHTILDFGCGKYTNHIREALPASCVYLPYDPYNQPDEVNARARYYTSHFGPASIVLCSNVLNVIDDKNEIQSIALQMLHALQPNWGRIFVTVYEGDASGEGKQTGKDSFQRNEKLKEYAKYFLVPGSKIEMSHDMLIITKEA